MGVGVYTTEGRSRTGCYKICKTNKSLAFPEFGFIKTASGPTIVSRLFI